MNKKTKLQVLLNFFNLNSILFYTFLSLVLALLVFLLFFIRYNLIIIDATYIKIFLFISFILYCSPFIFKNKYLIKIGNIVLLILILLFLISMYKLNIISHSTPYTTILEVEGVFKIQRFLHTKELLSYSISYCTERGYKFSNETLTKIAEKNAMFEDIVVFIEEVHLRESQKTDYSNLVLLGFVSTFVFGLFSSIYLVKSSNSLCIEIAANQAKLVPWSPAVLEQLDEFLKHVGLVHERSINTRARYASNVAEARNIIDNIGIMHRQYVDCEYFFYQHVRELDEVIAKIDDQNKMMLLEQQNKILAEQHQILQNKVIQNMRIPTLGKK